MKSHKSLSTRQLLLAIFVLAVFAGISIFLFTYKHDEKKYTHISSQVFYDEMLSSTLNMHYTLAYPENFGIHNYEAILPCYSAKGYLRSQAATENVLASLKKLVPEKLSDEDAYSYRLLTRSLDNSLRMSSYAYYEEPLSPSSGMQSQLPILLAEYTFRCKQDVTDYLSLLNQTDEYFASLLRYEKEKAAAGLLMPASSLEKVKKQCDTIVSKDELEQGTHFLQSTFRERVQLLCESDVLTSEEAEKFCAQNDRLLKTVLQPAYEALADGLFLLEDENIQLAGLASKPRGTEYYQYLLRSETGSYRSIDEIKELLSEAFHREYESIHTLTTENPDIFHYLSNEEADFFPYDNADDMLRDLQIRMQDDFPSLPTDNSGSAETSDRQSVSGQYPSVCVKTVSSSLEKYCAPAFYLTAPLDDTDNNVIYINEKNSPTGLELYTTLAHEGYPGHLYQTVYSNRAFLNNGENNVRQVLWYGGYLEGWALYVEFISYDYAAELMKERNQNMDSLYIELEKHNRSLQLCLYSLLDIMIHYENASYSQVAQVLEKFGIENSSAVKAIYTYIAEEPCNYLKYYLGYLEILELQKQAKALWGTSYTDYAFHKFYLDCGPSDFTSLLERLEPESETERKNEFAFLSALSKITCSSAVSPSTTACIIS